MSSSAPGGLDGLNPQDPGVRLLARRVVDIPPERLLLVHCGSLPGHPGGATRLVLDVREHTGSRDQCIADPGRSTPDEALPVTPGQFDAACVWPRAHLGKDFSEACLALGALALAPGGSLYCAARKQKGGKSLGKRMKAMLGDDAVEVVERDRGYHLWRGTLGPRFDRELATELSCQSYRIEDPVLGELQLSSRPGVFSRRELDGGTRALIHVAAAILEHEGAAGLPAPQRVLDLCAGIGPLALWAAHNLPEAQVYAVESNLRAAALLRTNADANELGERVQVFEHDGLPQLPEPVELALINPPTHADTETLARLLDVREALAPGGRALIVVSRPQRALRVLDALGATISGGDRDGYSIISAQF